MTKIHQVKGLWRLPSLMGNGFRLLHQKLWDVLRRLDLLREAVGRIEARQLAAADVRGEVESSDLAAHEFRVFSQWGEDGILQHLIRHVPIPRRLFVEFGVEDYQEANTRFLLMHDNWAGLVLDGSETQVRAIRDDSLYWRHNLKAVHAFITRDNIDTLLSEHGVTGDIGLLSIDIDGMDYWVWEAIDSVRPAIVVIEYNARFGPERAVTVPYRDDFDRRAAHPSLTYYGASLAALEQLGRSKGYDLIGCGSAGLNAFFVRSDLRPESLPATSAREAFVPSAYREAHDDDGSRLDLRPQEEAAMLEALGLPLVEVEVEVEV